MNPMTAATGGSGVRMRRSSHPARVAGRAISMITVGFRLGYAVPNPKYLTSPAPRHAG
jgi:hypothetical protein